MNPFTTQVTFQTKVARVRVVHHSSKYGPEFSGWHVEYLPVGCSKWWWNWKTAARFTNETGARQYADEISNRGYATDVRYVTKEFEL